MCQIYTDVDGVYTADPRTVKGARKLQEVTYNEMLELATLAPRSCTTALWRWLRSITLSWRYCRVSAAILAQR